MQPLLSIQNLSVDFISGTTRSTAIKNISFSVSKGEIVALVGESGSGKSVTSLSILQLLPSPPAHYASGQILFSEDGTIQTDLLQKDRYGLQAIRGNKIAMIFQEPMTSLNPVLTCGAQIMEALLAHKKIKTAKPGSYFQPLSPSVKRRTKAKGNDRHGHVLRTFFTHL